MLILRLAIVLFIVTLFLPSSPEEKQQVYQSVSDAVQSLRTFCERNAKLCDNVGFVAGAVADRAYYGALIVYDAAMEPQQKDGRGTDLQRAYPPQSQRRHRRDDEQARARPARSRDTLRREDRAPEWRGPGAS